MNIKKKLIAVVALVAIVGVAIYGSTLQMSGTGENRGRLSGLSDKETLYFWYADDAMTDAIMDVLSNSTDPICISDIVDKIQDASAQKVTYRLGKLFKSDKIIKDTKTIKTDAGSRRVTFYAVKA